MIRHPILLVTEVAEVVQKQFQDVYLAVRFNAARNWA